MFIINYSKLSYKNKNLRQSDSELSLIPKLNLFTKNVIGPNMRRRELQSISLKLSELKEYEQAKAERTAAEKGPDKPPEPEPGTSKPAESIATTSEPKTRDEVKERIGMTM